MRQYNIRMYHLAVLSLEWRSCPALPALCLRPLLYHPTWPPWRQPSQACDGHVAVACSLCQWALYLCALLCQPLPLRTSRGDIYSTTETEGGRDGGMAREAARGGHSLFRLSESTTSGDGGGCDVMGRRRRRLAGSDLRGAATAACFMRQLYRAICHNAPPPACCLLSLAPQTLLASPSTMPPLFGGTDKRRRSMIRTVTRDLKAPGLTKRLCGATPSRAHWWLKRTHYSCLRPPSQLYSSVWRHFFLLPCRYAGFRSG